MVQVYYWILVPYFNGHAKEGIVTGWLFAKKEGPKKGQRLESSHFELDMLTILMEVQEVRPNLIPVGLDMMDVYGTYRSFQHGATMEARNAKVSKDAIELNNG